MQSNLVSSGLIQEVVVQEGRGDQKRLYREQVENDMQFASSKWVQCGRQQGAQNIEKLNLRFQLWSFDWKWFSVFNLRRQEPMTSVLTVLISGSRSRDELRILLQENALTKKTQEQRSRHLLQHLQKYNTIQRGYDYRHKPCTQ